MTQTTFHVRTPGPGLVEITEEVARWLPPRDGLLTLFLRHTSASLLIQENADPEVQTDLLAWLSRLVPPSIDPSLGYLTHTYEGPDDMPGHIRAMLLPVSLSIPVERGRMLLGRWQGLFVFEHRDRPHDREVAAHFLG
ncbi:secondary thiamine-phosphate synthase enzyme YjbQ [Jannaschia sp. W003]|uniref:secondary thiamine-phosphate synthase enzyme YjbQ n=1 Tax=Jannaschia sp. W003 TaxID=2867012 RepID=UPI0021A8C957|nr:secondary thiamine-phosphate synthase enzyme YjbQ [Jannaschia sp. W003]UWQ20020.1 secondary thiamine-phosphate synthase enzyme YjbQ [Jannaschia sp. W003]